MGFERTVADDPLLDGLTCEQRPCVRHFGGPLVVSAGAGSGKTFMLTRRIVYALSHPQESGVESMDQVLAITFTSLAASEIKARVRSALRQAGMSQQALAVDSSWISTIHGMCARILRENALELGIDPSFAILSDARRLELLAQAANQALSQAGVVVDAGRDEDGMVATAGVAAPLPDDDEDAPDGPDAGDPEPTDILGVADTYGSLFKEHESGSRGSGVAELLTSLLMEASNVADGLDAVHLGPDPAPAREVASRALDAFESLRGPVAAYLASKKTSVYSQKASESVERGAALLAPLAADRDVTYEQVADALCSCTFKFGRAPKDLAQANMEFRIGFDMACAECAAALARVPMEQLLKLARATQDCYEGLKAQLHAMDQDDLLRHALHALRDVPEVRAAYEDRFRMVMVDEFQDTSDLQIKIVDLLCGQDRARLCTVGDAQQSIYRFRGADVQTYRKHSEQTTAMPGSLEGRLSRNFRSHPAVISFVNRVFSQESVFGARPGEFIELDTPPGRDSCLPGPARPLVEVVAVTNAWQQGRASERTQVLAQEVCQRFTQLHDEGAGWGDMVILLGAMRNADVYAQTLRAHGVPCVISGGSIFATSPDAQLVMNLACVLTDPYDDARMVPLLSHDAFGLSPDEMLLLGTGQDGYRRHLWDGLRALGPSDSNPRVRLAWSTLACAVHDAGLRPVRETLEYALLQTGWLDRMLLQGAEGTARAADALKAARMAGDIQRERAGACGMAQVAWQMAQDFERGMKEAPGALNAQGQNAVRIMTVHASKGLEFPVVALCDFIGARASSVGLSCLAKGPDLYASLGLRRSVKEDSGRWELLRVAEADLPGMLAKADAPAEGSPLPAEPDGEDMGCDPALSTSPAGFADAIRQANALGEMEESRRKLYVGATRPRELLILGFGCVKRKEKPGVPPYSDQLVEDLRQGLCGADDFPDDALVPLDVPESEGDPSPQHRRRMSVAIRHLRVSRDEEGGALVDGVPIEMYLDQEEDEAGQDAVHVPEPVNVASLVPAPTVAGTTRAGEFSYSSISTDGATYAELNRRRAQQDGLGGDDWRADFDEVARPRGQEDVEPGDDLAPERADRDVPGLRAASGDGQDATSLGSALHSAAQWMAEDVRARRARGDAGAALELPPDERLMLIAAAWGAGQEALPRLREALARWAGSEVAAQVLARPTLCPEVPVYALTLDPQGDPSHLNGTVDLVAYDASAPLGEQRALAVDYKTGTSPVSSAERLHGRHLLQASCYAIGLLSQGFAGVDLRFVRVEAPDPERPGEGQPQVASYAFDRSQLPQLEERVRAARREAAERARREEVGA